MKKRIAILAIVVTCLAMLILASHTEAITPAAAEQFERVLLPTSTGTPMPTLAPDTFSMVGAVTYKSPDNVFSIKIPKSWHVQTPLGSKYYTFTAGDLAASPANFVVQFSTKSELMLGLNLDATTSSARDILQQLRKQLVAVPSTTLTQIYAVRVGNLNGFGLTVTTKDTLNQTIDLRIAELNKTQLIVTYFATYQQYWAKAKPVLDRMMASLVVKPQNIPTITPTFTATPVTPTPTLVFTPSALSDIHQSVADDGSPLVGDPNAAITVLEFIDFSCPHCREYQPVMRQVLDKYVRSGDVRIVVRFLRFVGGSYSEFSAEAAICAAKQGHFIDMEEALFSVEEQQTYEAYTPETIRAVSSQLKLDGDKMSSCMTDPATLTLLAKDETVASGLGVTGVPSVFYAIDGIHFTGIPNSTGQFVSQPSFEDFSKAIESAFNAGSKL